MSLVFTLLLEMSNDVDQWLTFVCLLSRYACAGSDDYIPGATQSSRYAGGQSSYREVGPRAYRLDILVSTALCTWQ